MKTVLVDNSLCALTIKDDAEPSDIAAYIHALAHTGVKYVEIDFRALLKLRHLPEGVGYIFRPVDPMFMRFTEVLPFDYIILSAADIMKYKNVGGSVMLSLPLPPNYMNRSPRDIIRCADEVLNGQVTELRIRGNFPLISQNDAVGYLNYIKSRISVPVDICPMNNCRTALNTAMSFMNCQTDSITVTMGSSERYCSLEELMITIVAMYGGLPKGLDMSGLCAAAALHTRVFKNSMISSIPDLVKVFENDLGSVRNADTGECVSVRAAVPRERRFAQSFSEILKGIHSDWSIHDDAEPKEAAKSAAAKLYNDTDGEKKSLTAPFLN